MSSSTKIVVLRSKEIVYSVVLLIVSILIILVAVSIFAPSGNGSKASPTQTPQNTQPTQDLQAPATESNKQSLLQETQQPQDAYDTAQLYVPGIYTGVLQLGSSAVELQLTVDKNHINSITFTNIDDAVATMYPLMQPTLSELSSEIIEQQSLDNVTYAEESRYTSMLLLNTISDLLEKARASENADSPAQLSESLNVQ